MAESPDYSSYELLNQILLSLRDVIVAEASMDADRVKVGLVRPDHADAAGQVMIYWPSYNESIADGVWKYQVNIVVGYLKRVDESQTDGELIDLYENVMPVLRAARAATFTLSSNRVVRFVPAGPVEPAGFDDHDNVVFCGQQFTVTYEETA